MANKTVNYTQVPIAATDMESITLTPGGGTIVNAVLHYQIRDSLSAVRAHNTVSKAYATPGAFTILDMVAVANTQEGT